MRALAATLALALALTLAACSKSAPSDCERAVRQVILTATPRDMPPPSSEEAEVIRSVIALTVSVCEREGLSAAQRDCILGTEDIQVMLECPAIVERRPSWIIGTRRSARPSAP